MSSGVSFPVGCPFEMPANNLNPQFWSPSPSNYRVPKPLLNPIVTRYAQCCFMEVFKELRSGLCPMVSYSSWSYQLTIEMLTNNWKFHFWAPVVKWESPNPYWAPLHQNVMVFFLEEGHRTASLTMSHRVIYSLGSDQLTWNAYDQFESSCFCSFR